MGIKGQCEFCSQQVGLGAVSQICGSCWNDACGWKQQRDDLLAAAKVMDAAFVAAKKMDLVFSTGLEAAAKFQRDAIVRAEGE